jgi:HAD superfamily hydrolase (TIGR01509 family)
MAAVIFDMDGLLIDSERATMAAWMHGARRAGVALAPADYLQVVGRAAPESDAILSDLLGGPQAFGAARDAARAALNHAEAVFPIRPGAAELLAALRAAHVPCAVASSSTHAEIRHRLGALGVLRHFDALAGGERGKPDPALYRLAAQRLGVDAGRCIAFEDSENGARAALAAGAHVVVVPDLKPPTPALAARVAHVLVSLHEALDHLPRWFAHATHAALRFEPATEGDLEALVALRVAAMRDSLERLGRFDPGRARERLRAGFSPTFTWHLVAGGERVGFVVVRPEDDALRLDDLCVAPAAQRRGLGSAALRRVIAAADATGRALRTTTPRGSDANRFYARHGFVQAGEGAFDFELRRDPAPTVRCP